MFVRASGDHEVIPYVTPEGSNFPFLIVRGRDQTFPCNRLQVYDIGDSNLSYKYSYKYLGAAKDRLLQAGVRLAGLLNQIYGK